MRTLDNAMNSVGEDLRRELRRGDRLSIAASCFSIYAFEALKKELKGIDELRFIFTSPTFLKEAAPKAQREFYIPRLERERSLCGTPFEIKLKNELTQKAIAGECAAWINKKVCFRSNNGEGSAVAGFMAVEHEDSATLYLPIGEFSTVGLGLSAGNNIFGGVAKFEQDGAAMTEFYLSQFNRLWEDKKSLADVTERVLEGISAAYRENAPEFIYFLSLYHIFHEFLEDISEENLPRERARFRDTVIWQKLYRFQRDAAYAIIGKLEEYNGCILADSVGLGKTFTALAVIKYYEMLNRNVLVLCPKKLYANWNTYKGNYDNNPLVADRLRYDVLFHTDLSRDGGESGGIDLEHLNWGNYDLVVIDESHNFRNGVDFIGKDRKENRYTRLLNKVIRAGVKTKVLMLSATPVNNRFNDLKNQLALAYEGDSSEWGEKLGLSRKLDEVFKSAQKTFNEWGKGEERTTETLLGRLDFDFFKVLDSVTIARSRKHIQKYYGLDEVGSFPAREAPLSLRPPLTDLLHAATYGEIYELLNSLNLAVYTPTQFIQPSKLYKYEQGEKNLTTAGREAGIRRLMSINLLKRLESSVHSFTKTVGRIKDNIERLITIIDCCSRGQSLTISMTDYSGADVEDAEDLFTVSKKMRIDLRDMDYLRWRHYLLADAGTLTELLNKMSPITPAHDAKLQRLKALIDEKLAHPLNAGNKKLLIFTAFADTADYLYEHIAPYVREKYGLECGEVTGSREGRTTAQGMRADFNTILTAFSPRSKEARLLKSRWREIDLLIATDCISEGQNLQDCDCLVNYDIHWNPVRIIQRFGRIDRIGSKNGRIRLINFWPDISLDEYLGLEARVEARMAGVVATATGDDNLLAPEEKGDAKYRREQLKRLQTEIIDLEDMNSGVSITDLGLNEFRMELLAYLKTHPELENAPLGVSAVVSSTEDAPPGCIFILKNRAEEIDRRSQNRLHPFYLAYMSEDGEVIKGHLAPKEVLEIMRQLAHGKAEPDLALAGELREVTRDGRDMSLYSALLSEAVRSFLQAEETGALETFLSGGAMSFFDEGIKGLDDFELVAFLIVRERSK